MIRIGRESQCLPYAGFFHSLMKGLKIWKNINIYAFDQQLVQFNDLFPTYSISNSNFLLFPIPH